MQHCTVLRLLTLQIKIIRSSQCCRSISNLFRCKLESVRSTVKMPEERLVLIDTDAGIDDAMAMLMTIQAHNKKELPFRLIAITCCSGNTGVDNVVKNVARTLQVMGKESEIPIFRGSSGPMVVPHEVKLKFYGEDGFGDVKEFKEIQVKVETEHAVNAIVRLTHEYPGKLTILALGPLTNLAMAVRMDPTISNTLKDIYFMGGNIQGAGNDSICAEFNFMYDAEAAQVVLSAFECPIFVVPLEVGRDSVMQTFEWRTKELSLEAFNTPESKLINTIEVNNLENWHKPRGKWTSYDCTAAVALLAPHSIIKQINHHCLVELNGTHTRGQLIIDFLPHLQPPGNVHIVTKMDNGVYQDMLKWALGGPCPLKI